MKTSTAKLSPASSRLSEAQVRWFRLRNSGLVNPFPSPEAAASALAGVQAQILPAAGLSLWNRTDGLTHAGFEERLYVRRSLIKVWGQRMTLHVYASQEWPLFNAATQTRRSWWERQGEEVTGSDEAYRALVMQVAELLRERGTIGRSDLRASGLDLDEAFFSSWGGIFAGLVRGGYACHAQPKGGEGRFAHREHWLPGLAWDLPSTEEANVEMVRRYFRTYGPATRQDLYYWRGVAAGDIARWVGALAGELVEVSAGGKAMLALKEDLEALHEAPPPRGEWPVRMLYRFDPLLMAYKDKTWLMEPRYFKRVMRPAGHIEGTLLDTWGRVVATWRYDRAGTGLSISVAPFGPLSRRVRAGVQEISAQIAAFFGVPLQGIETLKR